MLGVQRALALRRVAGAHGGADAGDGRAHLLREGSDLRQGLFEVLLDVVGERLQRRDVDHLRGVGQFRSP